MFISIIKKISILFILTILLLVSPNILDIKSSKASAQNSISAAKAEDANNNAFSQTLCNVLDMATGNGGKAFAAFAIISLGIGFFTGKVSWGLMLGVAAGIAAMFGAPTIVAAISGSGQLDCDDLSKATT